MTPPDFVPAADAAAGSPAPVRPATGDSAAYDGHADDAEAMVSALLTASRLLLALSARSIAAVDDALTLPQFRMLVTLESRGEVSLTGLAAELDVQPSTAMRMIDRLAAAGMVRRAATPKDRRTTLISLTDAGRSTVARVTEHRRRAIVPVVAAMPGVQRRSFVEALQSFAEAGREPPVGHPAPSPDPGW